MRARHLAHRGLATVAATWLVFAVVPPFSRAAQETASAPDGDIENGKRVFITYGCYACHGIEGQGGFAGPKLGPEPMAFPAFVRYVRAPLGTMPPYTETLLPDEQDLADMHAYLRARPGPAPLSVLPPP